MNHKRFSPGYRLLLIVFFACAYSATLSASTEEHSANECTFSAAELAEISKAALLASNPSREFIHCDGNFLALDTAQLQRRQNGTAQLTLQLPVNRIADTQAFAGLAAYYNTVRAVRLNTKNGVSEAAGLPLDTALLRSSDWIGLQGRYKVLLLSAPGTNIKLQEDKVTLHWPDHKSSALTVYLGPPRLSEASLTLVQPDFSPLRYSQLWPWLASLCRGIEWLLEYIQKLGLNWGLSIILLAVALKTLLLPVSLLTTRLQNEVNRKQAILEPKLASIKSNFDGEAAHNRIMAEYKALNITPFFTLKPLLGTVVQLPFLVAAFNVLGETPLLNGQSFLWVRDLAYPDAIAALPWAIPMMGSTLNLLPFVMTLVTVVATLSFNLKHASIGEAKKQRRNLYFMSAAFFFLFYPFPAAMVLYWTMTNALQLLQQKLASFLQSNDKQA